MLEPRPAQVQEETRLERWTGPPVTIMLCLGLGDFGFINPGKETVGCVNKTVLMCISIKIGITYELECAYLQTRPQPQSMSLFPSSRD